MAHFIIRGLLFPAAPTDDAEQLLFSQVLRWGYDVVNPPLYTWLVIAVQQIAGVEIWSVSLIKFPAYWLIFHFLYVLGRRVIEDDGLAALAALSPLWLYYIAWDAVQSYSHTVLATALILATLVCLFRLQEKSGVSSYILFGAVLGLGILSKYTFALAAAGILVSALAYHPYRSKILRPGMVLSVAIAGVIIAPHIFWLYQQSDLIGESVSGKFGIGAADAGFFETGMKGLFRTVTSGIGFLSPLWLVLLVAFWRPVRQRLKIDQPVPAPGGVMDARGMLQMANKFLEMKIPVNDFSGTPLNFEFDRISGRKEQLRYILFDPGRGKCR
ncbi:MAG: glycosyltransferase family 39 protein [Rhodospirillales bacterium]|nr:glycosyltransferase family 39 protein [Rhodospirillales bacterium]